MCRTADGCLSIVEDGPAGGPGLGLAFRVDEAGALGRAEDAAVARLLARQDAAGAGGEDALLQRVWTAGSGYANASRAWARTWLRTAPPAPWRAAGGDGLPGAAGGGGSAARGAAGAGRRGAGRLVGGRGGTRLVRRRRRAVTGQEGGDGALRGGSQADEEEAGRQAQA